MARPTLKSISKRTGYSLTTISRALKDGPEVKPETIAKVKAIAQELGYRPDPSGLRLRTGKTFVICAIIPVIPVIQPGQTVGDLGSLRLVKGLTEALKGTNYHLMVLPDSGTGDRMEDVRYVVESGIADGLILNLTSTDDRRVRYLHEQKFPFITFGRTELSFDHAFFDVDNIDFAYRASSALYKKGRFNQRIVVSDLSYSYCVHQWMGFKRAALEHGVEVNQQQHLIEEAKIPSYDELVVSMQSSDETVDGIIFPGEITCLGVLSSLQKRGKTIGKDIDLVTLENSHLVDFFGVPITSFHQDTLHVGNRLSTMLLEQIDGKPAEDLQELVCTNLREAGV
ncbi:LacI family DNA-binding transcriptional regulator [Alginatibacterium sediminis]|uniref:LacI family DNA-binding transcriptional regulator n=1 Tax=Alginatibacterium sediminis TaxID=2164068 RepID=A0A420ECZ9_9ALTE|nr:substrate-binding domain-containing protein [Alginatibacterium sediminis]RKF18543.1 LacI family DNA-binding transcriptional regulator [Alginatibacterium sediminis]